MIDDALDDGGDLYVGPDQELASVQAAPEVGQSCAITLRAIQGEYAPDTTFGVALFERVLTKPFKRATADREYRRSLAGTVGLLNVLDVDLRANNDTLQVEGAIEINTIYGRTGVEI